MSGGAVTDPFSSTLRQPWGANSCSAGSCRCSADIPHQFFARMSRGYARSTTVRDDTPSRRGGGRRSSSAGRPADSPQHESPWLKLGLSETGDGITGALCIVAWRVVLDPMSGLHHMSAMHRLGARRCSGSFHNYSHARRGASPLRLPACRAGQGYVSPPNCRPGPRSSRSGSVFPEAEHGVQGPPLVLSRCCFLSWQFVHHRFENRDVRLVCHQLLGVGDHAPRPPGSLPWW
jgi:hypothetical protein